MKIEFLKDSKWRINGKVILCKKGSYADIPEEQAQKMINKKYGVIYEDIEEKKERERQEKEKKEYKGKEEKEKVKEEEKRKKKEEKKRKKNEKVKQKNYSIHTPKNKHEIDKNKE